MNESNSFFTIEIEEKHCIYWNNFIFNSLNNIHDQYVGEVGKELINIINSVSVQINKPGRNRLVLSFKEVAVLYDQLEMYNDILRLTSGFINELNIMSGYTRTLREVVVRNNDLYEEIIKIILKYWTPALLLD